MKEFFDWKSRFLAKIRERKFFRAALGLKINRNNIAAAHSLPTKNKEKPRPITVRFADKELKYEVLKVLKNLKEQDVQLLKI
jgi:hypothetical protein